MKHPGPVLVDTNAIVEAHRVHAWNALARGYAVDTVEDCVAETQTGFQRRAQERRIEAQELRRTLAAVHSVPHRQRVELELRLQGIALDLGEASLWAHAIERQDNWVLCGPDKASMRCGIRLGHRERLASLERLLRDAGHRPKFALRNAYTQRWLNQTLNELALEERRAWDHSARTAG